MMTINENVNKESMHQARKGLARRSLHMPSVETCGWILTRWPNWVNGRDHAEIMKMVRTLRGLCVEPSQLRLDAIQPCPMYRVRNIHAMRILFVGVPPNPFP